MKRPKPKTMNLRIRSRDLHKALVASAKANRRSLNQEMCIRLTASLAAEDLDARLDRIIRIALSDRF